MWIYALIKGLEQSAPLLANKWALIGWQLLEDSRVAIKYIESGLYSPDLQTDLKVINNQSQVHFKLDSKCCENLVTWVIPSYVIFFSPLPQTKWIEKRSNQMQNFKKPNGFINISQCYCRCPNKTVDYLLIIP